MTFDELVHRLGDRTVFQGDEFGQSPAYHVQLTRWVRRGLLTRIHRGVYTRAGEPEPHPFLVANLLVRDSYVSCYSALLHHGLLPKWSGPVTSVSPGRPRTMLNRFQYQRIRDPSPTVTESPFRLADPNTALMDLFYLTRGSQHPEWQRSLRLGNLHTLDHGLLYERAWHTGSPRLKRAAGWLGLRIRAAQRSVERRKRGDTASRTP